MLKKDLFVFRHGMFRKSHISDPVINDVKDLALPRGAIYHFLDPDGLVSGPRVSDPLIQKVDGICYISHITEYTKTEVTPIRKAGANVRSLETEFRNKNRAFRRILNPARNGSDEKALLIYNYSLIPASVTFPRSLRAPWYQFSAQITTLIDTINAVSKESKRDHYLIVELGESVPTLSDLVLLSRDMSNANLKRIPSFEDKVIFELFRWFGRGHSDSVFNRLDKKVIPRTNIILKRLDKWAVLNLGWLTSLNENFTQGATFNIRQFESVLVKLIQDIHSEGRPYVAVDEDPSEDTEGEETEPVSQENPTPEEEIAMVSLDLDTILATGADPSEDSSPGYDDSELSELESALLKEIAKAKPADDDMEIIELDDEELDALGEVPEDYPEVNLDSLSEIIGFDTDVRSSVALAGELNAKGVMTNREFNRIVRLADKFNEIPNPYNPDEKLSASLTVDPEETELGEAEDNGEKILVDKSLGRAKVDHFERSYVNGFLQRDILQSVSALQKGPVAITDYTIEPTEDSQNQFETHTIKITPVVGPPSTIRQILPVIKDDGTFKYSGTDYRMKMQRVDMPIRKISDRVVALNSYYGKLFVELNHKSASDYSGKVVNWIKGKLIDPEDTDFKDGSINAVRQNDPKIPLIYGSISEEVERFTLGSNNTKLTFDFKNRFSYLKIDEQEGLKLEGKKRVVIGKGRSSIFLLDANGLVVEVKEDNQTVLGPLEEFIGLDTKAHKIPTPQVGIKIYAKTVPIGFCLAQLLGFENLLTRLRARPRRVNMGERVILAPDEYSIKFRNQTLVFKRTNVLETMLLSGFNEYAKYIKDYDIVTFDERDVYSAIMDRVGLGNRYMKKLTSTATYFIDPITEKVLRLMNEPTEFIGLILRACEMLVTAYIPTEAENARASAKGLSRLRGYERVAGFAYETMVKAIEAQSMAANSARTPITVNPWDTMQIIRSDPTVAPADNLNPIQYLREREVITHTGRGGRSKRSMVAKTRVYQDEDVGVISEATVDSGDVGVIVYASQDADIRSVYGTSGAPQPGDKVDSAKLLSSAALLSPNADGDDPKRMSFISVQHGHGIQANGYEVQPLRTGNERSIVHRMSDTFAQVAKEDGKVTELTDTYVAVKYKSGEVKKYALGSKIITSTGSRYPQEIVTTALKVGHTYKKGDCVTYNKGFFSVNPLEKNKVDYMSGCLARVALREASYTLEDSCSVSMELAERLKSTSSEPHFIRVHFDQEINNVVKIGAEVEIGGALCLIEDSVSSSAGVFDDETRESLALVSSLSPTSLVSGRVAEMEVHYKGDIDFMSDSLKKLTKSIEGKRKKRATELDEPFIPNELNGDVRIGGQTVGTDEVMLVIYVNHDVPAGLADKLVFGNQGKSTIGEVLSGNTRSMDGQLVDSIFGAKSFIDRIITSPFKNGLANSYLMAVGEIAHDMWVDS